MWLALSKWIGMGIVDTGCKKVLLVGIAITHYEL